jgi:DNA end-binding protein Ku
MRGGFALLHLGRSRAIVPGVSARRGSRLGSTSLAGVEIHDLHDEYAAALEQLVAAKAAGGELEAPGEPEPSVDLMAALEASIREARRGRPTHPGVPQVM